MIFSITTGREWIRYLFCLALLGCLVTQAPAAVLFNDTFSDGERLTQNLPSSVRWYTTGLSAGTTVSGGQVISAPASGSSGLLGYLATPQAIEVGWALSFSFNYSFSTVVNGDYAFTFGLFNSQGSLASSDNTDLNDGVFNTDRGYFGSGVLGPDPSGTGRMHSHERTNNANRLLRAATDTATYLGAAIQTNGTLVGTTYLGGLSLYRTGADTMIVQLNIAGQTLTRTDTVSIVSSFDEFVIYGPAGAGTMTFDNIQLNYTQQLPEPGTAALLLLSGLCVRLFRRKRPPSRHGPWPGR